MNPLIIAIAVLVHVAADNLRRDLGRNARPILRTLPTELLVEIAINRVADRLIIDQHLGERGARILDQALTRWAINFQQGRPGTRGVDNMLRAFGAEFCA